MQLERSVAKTLENKGYYIFYRNLTISLPNKLLLTEYDIICRDFIIEVKSGSDICVKCNQIKNQIALLPKGFRLYYYCPSISDNLINEYNMNTKNNNNLITYINSLEVIYNIHKPYNECNIFTQRDFTKFLAYSMLDIQKFHKIYVTKETFYYTYLCITCINDHYSTADDISIQSSQKIKYLVANNILEMVKKLDETKPYFIKDSTHNTICVSDVANIKPIKIKLCYSIDWKTVKLKPVDLYYDLPIIEGITRYCNTCNKTIIFNKQICCGICYPKLREQKSI
jgi:hypothetical protein